MLSVPAAKPAASYEEALQRVRAFQALDDERILPQARTAFYDCGKRTQISIVLLHGLTNNPAQYTAFAPMLLEKGINVFVPRLPEQGDRNRMTRRLARLTAESLLASANEAVDIACGLGERVCVLGISTSGLLCAYFAQYRADVARAIPVDAVFGILHLPPAIGRAIVFALRKLPNFFMWWDPRHKTEQLPPTGYPRFPTHALAQAIRIGDDVYAQSRKHPFAAKSAVMVTNERDPAVNNAISGEVVRRWRRLRPDDASSYEFTDLPVNHDIIDPQNAVPRTDIVYPKLLELVLATP